MESSDNDSENSTKETANNSFNTLPKISRKKYEITYKDFINWCLHYNINSFSESTILSYFEHLSTNLKSSTLWSRYSMLRTTLSVKDNVDIAQYSKLRSFLKRQSDNYIAKKSKTLTSKEIQSFISEAPDEKYLLTKVALIIGIAGSCRREELWKLKTNNFQDLNTIVLIKIPDRKTKIQRTFTLTGNFYNIYKRYANLRPPNLVENRFFLNYQNGKCTKVVVGVNKFGKMPTEIALFLKLANPELYTGRCFRRTSACILVDAGGDLTTIKRHGRWRSSAVAQAMETDADVDTSHNLSKSGNGPPPLRLINTEKLTAKPPSFEFVHSDDVNLHIEPKIEITEPTLSEPIAGTSYQKNPWRNITAEVDGLIDNHTNEETTASRPLSSERESLPSTPRRHENIGAGDSDFKNLAAQTANTMKEVGEGIRSLNTKFDKYLEQNEKILKERSFTNDILVRIARALEGQLGS